MRHTKELLLFLLVVYLIFLGCAKYSLHHFYNSEVEAQESVCFDKIDSIEPKKTKESEQNLDSMVVGSITKAYSKKKLIPKTSSGN